MSYLKELKFRLKSKANSFLRQQRANDQRKSFWDADRVIVHELIKLPCDFQFHSLANEVYMNTCSSVTLRNHH